MLNLEIRTDIINKEIEEIYRFFAGGKYMLALIYHSWFWIAGISAIAGIATIIFSAKKRVGLPIAAEILRLIVFAVICSFGAAALATQHFFVEVPDICDQTLANAKTTLKDNDLNFAFALNCEDNSGMEQLGIVNYQSIDSGEIVLKGTTITIAYQQPEQNSGNNPITGIISHESDSLSSNTNSIISQFTVPNVVGMEQGDACDLLQLSGLQFQVWWDYKALENTDTYYIISQSPSAGDQVSAGTIIKLELMDCAPAQCISLQDNYITDDAMVHSAEEQRYFILKTPGTTCPSKYDLDSGEITTIDYIAEKLCYITLEVPDFDYEEIALSYRGASSGFLLSSSTLQKGIYLNKGHYTLSFTTESNCFDVELEIDHSGNYKIQSPN